MQVMTKTNWSFFQSKLKGFVLKRVKDKSLADDIIHDVFLKVHGKLDQLKDTTKADAWIYQIAQNTIVDHFRKQSRVINPLDVDWDSNWQALNECVTTCIRETLSTLPQPYREALELADLQNIPQKELAIKLHISYSGIKSRVQRAREMLKARMDERYRIEMDKYGNVLVCTTRVPCHCNNILSETCD
jgi:RNA polymerase sigma-70 factor (ECF subfamily)